MAGYFGSRRLTLAAMASVLAHLGLFVMVLN